MVFKDGAKVRPKITAFWIRHLSRTSALWCALALAGAEAIPNKDCLECHADKELTKTNVLGKTISLYVDEAKLKASVHATNACVACHSDLTAKHPDDNVAARPVDCAACHERQSETYRASAHALARQAGRIEAATCGDCHGGHEVTRPTSVASPLHFSRLAATCGECHPEAAQDVQQSVHGKAAAKGSRDAATCTDCHSEHRIETLKNGAALKVAGQICAKCHASERINTKYRLPSDRVKSFFESYHGLALQSGSALAANCASCHGVHKILPSSDPRSTINKDHLVETCGKCHPGANANFALGKVHLDEERGAGMGERVNRWVRRAYIGLIVVVISFLFLHNLLAWLKKALAAYRAADRTFVRMDRAHRIQHLVLVVSFVVLALSGFALKYPDSWLAWMFGSAEAVRRWVHRVAGVVLLVVGLYHLVYALATREGRQLLQDLLLRPQDLKDLGANARFLAGRNGAKAKFARFGYPEKLEYWAVVWGTIIMGVTGLMIWLKMEVTRFLPRWAVDVAVTVHYYEAILACLAIVVWHFYHVIFDPDVYPLNWAWWDGKVSPHWYQDEHPLDPAAQRPADRPASPPPSRVGKTEIHRAHR